MKINILSNRLIVKSINMTESEKKSLFDYINSDSLLNCNIDSYLNFYIYGKQEAMYNLLFEMSKDFDVELI